MNAVLDYEETQTKPEAEWRTILEAARKVGNLASPDDLLNDALNAWLEQAAPQLRWQIAVELYATEQVSLGRAAEISGLNYFVFLERLQDKGIALVSADITTKSQAEQQEALIHDVFDFAQT